MDHWRLGKWLVTVFWLSSCGSEPGAPADAAAISALDVDALPSNGGILVDLRPEDTRVRFDHRFGAIDYQRIGLVCPDGTGMPLDVWLMLIAQQIGVEYGLLEERLASLANAGEEAEGEEISVECLECYRCRDGAEICYWTCGEDDSSWESVCPHGQPDCRSAGYWIGALGDDGDDPDWDVRSGGDDDDDGASPWSDGGGDDDDSGGGGGGGGDGDGGGSHGGDGGGGGGSSDGGGGGGGGGSGGGGGASGGGDRDGW